MGCNSYWAGYIRGGNIKGLGKMKIYGAQHCGDRFEGGYATISLHLTKAGAERAVRNSKRKWRKEFNADHYPGRTMKFTDLHDWDIEEFEVLP